MRRETIGQVRTLFLAAGGGGDALGVLLARRILDEANEAESFISTCAWERLRIDPEPGPRARSGFTGLGEASEVTATTDTTPPGRSMLPRLARETHARVFVHDFEGGATGLAAQLSDLAERLGADRLTVLDVGGDVVAQGDEPTLLSPLADSLTLSAALAVGLPTTLAVLGPGVDGELSEDQVIQRLHRIGGRRVGSLTRTDADEHAHLLTWHPTEATAIAAAAAADVRGAVAMRRGGIPTPMTRRSAELWTVDTPRLEDFPLAEALASAGNLDQVEQQMRSHAVNELDFERQKAARPAGTTANQPLRQIAAEATAQGASHITRRRLAELASDQDAKRVSRLATYGLIPLGVVVDP